MDTGEQVTLKLYIEAIKQIARNANHLEQHKRRLSQTVHQIEDYSECFRLLDLDKKAAIYPKVMQNFMIKHKYYLHPEAISRFYSNYEDLLESLLPHQDYVLIANTISDISGLHFQPSKFVHSCQKERIKTIEEFTCFVLNSELQCLSEDYRLMAKVTRNSQRIGAILWRLLDRDHTNSLQYEKLQTSAKEVGVSISSNEWATFLYWNFHSYKRTINRSDFMRLLDIQEQRKRATSACQIEQFKLEQHIYRRAEEDRLRTLRIEEAVKQKLVMTPLLTKSHYRQIVKEEHFPCESLYAKKQLKGALGYSRPKNMVKYVVERYE